MKSTLKTLGIVLMVLAVMPIAFAINNVKPTLVDGHVYTGHSMFTPPAAGVTVDVTCEEETDSVVTDEKGYFRVLFATGDCDLGSNVTACVGDNCDSRVLIGSSARINLLGFKLFDVPEFSTVAAGLAVAGASVGYLALRRRQ